MIALQVFIWIIATAIAVVVFYLLYRNIEHQRRARLQYALLAYQSHTNPHFIKNVLQAINWFILNNEREMASDYLCDFSRLMDDILKFSKKNFITLTEKLQFLDLYLKLQHLRHKDKFDYVPINNQEGRTPTISVAEGMNPEVFQLPPLLIHPYIENAIEHGLKPKKLKGMLSVDFRFKGNKLVCSIVDDGIGIEASRRMQLASSVSRSRIGLVNTHKRIEIIRKLYGIDIKETVSEYRQGYDEPGTIVRLEFPMPIVFNPLTGMPKDVYIVPTQ